MIWFIVLLLILGAGAVYYLYKIVFDPNVWTPKEEVVFVTIPTGSDYENVKQILYQNGLIIHRNNFE